jgi:RNA polymerase-binding transcription factor DksA
VKTRDSARICAVPLTLWPGLATLPAPEIGARVRAQTPRESEHPLASKKDNSKVSPLKSSSSKSSSSKASSSKAPAAKPAAKAPAKPAPKAPAAKPAAKAPAKPAPKAPPAKPAASKTPPSKTPPSKTPPSKTPPSKTPAKAPLPASAVAKTPAAKTPAVKLPNAKVPDAKAPVAAVAAKPNGKNGAVTAKAPAAPAGKGVPAAKGTASKPGSKVETKPGEKSGGKAKADPLEPPAVPKKGPIDLAQHKSVAAAAAAVANARGGDSSDFIIINGRRVRAISTKGLPVAKKTKDTSVETAAAPTEQQIASIKTKLAKKELDEYRALLLAKRRQLVGMLSGMEDEALRSPGGNLSNMPVHMADMGSDVYEQDFTLGMAEAERVILGEIDAALQRIEDKTFGVCQMTGKPITKARLDAKPWAKYTIESERIAESSGGR